MSELFAKIPDRGRAVAIGTTTRRVVMALLVAYAVVGLAGVLGQQTKATTARADAATMTLTAPRVTRAGLLFQTRIDIRAAVGLERPRLILDPDVLEGMQVNSIEPQPMSESSRDGRLELSFPQVIAGERLRIWMQFQVDPTYTGRRHYRFDLDEGTRRVAFVDRTLTVLP
jgi:hypothetical protein